MASTIKITIAAEIRFFIFLLFMLNIWCHLTFPYGCVIKL